MSNTKTTAAPRAAKPAEPKATALYRVLSPLQHSGEPYEIGEEIELSEAQAAPLLGHTVEPVDAG